MSDLNAVLAEMGRLLQWASHDGIYEPGKEFWQQEIEEFRAAWEQLTDPANVDLLRAWLGTAHNADWNRIFDEAYRQSLARSERAHSN